MGTYETMVHNEGVLKKIGPDNLRTVDAVFQHILVVVRRHNV